MYRRLQDDNLRMQRELEATIYNLKAQVYELEQNGRVASSLNPSQEKCNLPHFDNSNTELLQLRVSFMYFCILGHSSKLYLGNYLIFVTTVFGDHIITNLCVHYLYTH